MLQVKRAKKFLDILFEHAPEQVVVVVTHSGFTRSLLLAVKREPYRPMNAELVPVLVEKVSRRRKADTADDDDYMAASKAGQQIQAVHDSDGEQDDNDSWIDAVLKGYEGIDLSEDDRLRKSSSSSTSGSQAAVRANQQQEQQQQASNCMLRRLAHRLASMWRGQQTMASQ